MKWIEHYKIISTGKLGTNVTLQLLFTEEPTEVVISVFDPGSTELVNDASTNDSGEFGRFFVYNYQSDTDRIGGTYTFAVQATISGFLVYDTFTFDLVDLNLENL